ncbi:putative transcriptional regulator [Candidatus Methanoperedens nitroreducens]|uniref:Putative transcriptional regulator n=1 Tax=Candidatus Methanoperedens nitratireducens TaxID=1392998 RepID=A0A062V116_9EURY|nr:transcriptional regulator [Candidatus Methanoperedens nitroreducens]KCZ70328.1 putative transcriptional regulator [Candidatus Methanoperedens nitroreducens]MDJ1421366.1 transcriptional regulator [Candidatus Methanoperedens sp.]
MRPPCEIVVQKVLPAIRAELARIMLESGLPQQEVASRLCLSKAAISQYVSAKRGRYMPFPPDTEEKIKELAKSLAEDLEVNDAVSSLCAVCRDIQSSGWLCKEHMQKNNQCTYCLKR